MPDTAVSPSDATEADRLAALVASRICHDLVSPVGAVANGVELLQLDGRVGQPELALLADSVAGATTRLKLMRLAFGSASESQTTGRTELLQTLAQTWGNGRLAVQWSPPGDMARSETRLALLCILCCETALPRGGQVHVTLTGTAWRVEGRGERLRREPQFDAMLAGGPLPEGARGAEVQFALAPRAAAALRRKLRVTWNETGVAFTF